MADRHIPLVTAAYGTRVARPAITTSLQPGGYGSQLGPRVRPLPGDTRLVGKGRRRPAAAGRWVRSRLHAGRATEVRSGKVLGPATRPAAASRKTSVRPPCPCSRSPRRRCRATASDFLAAGFDSYLSKPVNVVKLVHTVRQQCPDVGREGPLPARLLWHWRTLELSRAFPRAATAGRDGQPLPTGWK